MSAAGILYEVHDTFYSAPIDCRVNYTYGPTTLVLPIYVDRGVLPDPYTREDLATACADVLGFPVTVWAPAP